MVATGIILFLLGIIIGLFVGITRTISSMEKDPDRWIGSGLVVSVKRITKEDLPE